MITTVSIYEKTAVGVGVLHHWGIGGVHPRQCALRLCKGEADDGMGSTSKKFSRNHFLAQGDHWINVDDNYATIAQDGFTNIDLYYKYPALKIIHKPEYLG